MRILTAIWIIILTACGSRGDKQAGLTPIDLMQYGMPIKIMAPDGAVGEGSDLGVMKDVIVKGDDNFFVQITSGLSMSNDLSSVIADLKGEVSGNELFDGYIQEEEHGFVFKKKIGDRTNHDFRYVKIQGDQEYLFQTGFMGQFTLEEVQLMYNAVK